jgi:hypothetical protein
MMFLCEIDGVVTNDPEVVALRNVLHTLQDEVAVGRCTPAHASKLMGQFADRPRAVAA